METPIWGYADGSGDPIRMAPSEYSDAYVLSRDFHQAASVSVNDDQAAGNTANNVAKAYPGATRVESARQNAAMSVRVTTRSVSRSK